MARIADKTLKTESGIYKSQINGSNKYIKEKTDQIILRVPKGFRDKIKKYLNKTNKFTSVNSMIINLLENEIGKYCDYVTVNEFLEAYDISDVEYDKYLIKYDDIQQDIIKYNGTWNAFIYLIIVDDEIVYVCKLDGHPGTRIKTHRKNLLFDSVLLIPTGLTEEESLNGKLKELEDDIIDFCKPILNNIGFTSLFEATNNGGAKSLEYVITQLCYN